MGEQQEQVFLTEQGVTVSTTRFVVEAAMYPVNGITAVSTAVHPSGAGKFLLMVGVLIGLVVMAQGNNVVAVLCFVGGLAAWWFSKPSHTVVIAHRRWPGERAHVEGQGMGGPRDGCTSPKRWPAVGRALATAMLLLIGCAPATQSPRETVGGYQVVKGEQLAVWSTRSFRLPSGQEVHGLFACYRTPTPGHPTCYLAHVVGDTKDLHWPYAATEGPQR